MKILYIASHRRAAEDAASALRTVAQDIGVVWAASLGGGRLWIDKNRQVATVVLEVESDDPASESFINQIRGIGITAPVIVVSTKDPAPPLLALKAAADQVLTKDRSFLGDLPHVVTRLLNSPRPAPRRRLFAEAVAAADRLSRPGALPASGPDKTAVEKDALTRLNDTLAAIAQSRVEPPAARAQSAPDDAPQESSPAIAPPAAPGAATREQIAREQLERRLAEASAVLKQADERARTERHAAEQAAIARHAELEASVRQEVAKRQAAERALAEATAALKDAEARLAAAVETADARLAEQQRLHQARLADAAAALDEARSQHGDEMARRTADAEAAQVEAETRAAHAVAALEAIEARVLEVSAARHRAEQDAEAARQAAQHASDRLARLEAELAREVSARESLAEARADLEQAMRLARAQHDSELESLRAAQDDEARRAEASLAAASETIDALRAEVAEMAAAVARAEDTAAAERAAAVEAAQQHAAVDAQIAEEAARRARLEADLGETRAELTDTQAALRRAEERHTIELGEASARLADAQLRAESRAAQAAAATDELRARLVEGAAALQRAEQQAAADRQAMADEASERRARFHSELSEEIARREMLEKQVAAAERRLRQQDEWHAEQLAAATARVTAAQNEADARLAEAAAAAAALQASLDERTEALARLETESARERERIVAEAAQERMEAEAALARALATRHALEQALGAERTARDGDRAQAQSQLAAVERKHAEALSESQAQHASALAATAARHEAAVAAADEAHRAAVAALEAARDEARDQTEAAVVRAVAEATLAAEAATARLKAERDALSDHLARQRVEFDTQLTRERGRREGAEADAAGARTAAAEAERRFLGQVTEMRQRARDHEAQLEARAARARADWETAIAERDDRIQRLNVACDAARQSLLSSEEQIARLTATHQQDLAAAEGARLAAETELGHERSGHAAVQAALEDARRVIADLTAQLASVTAELDAARKDRDALKTHADRVPSLVAQIEETRRAQQRQFLDSPLALCRCRPDGSILHVNRPLARLLGYNSPAELEQIDFAAAVFESGAELPWIVDRRLRSGSTDAVDTTWRRKDRTKIIVRLRVIATSADGVDLIAEDITAVRSLEERLKNAQRMEAVARYAAEVAATCDTLLRDVRQEAQEWLSTLPNGAPRYHGELVVDELTRAAGLLRQLSVYGQQQRNAADLVNVPTVLRDLEPVLRRVAGGDIDIVLPDTSMPLHVDVDAERVERILVNVAAYARGRMASSGRLTFDVAAVMMDRTFYEKYPNVRPGAHVLLTVTEVRGTTPPAVAAAAPPADADAASGADRTGVDLGTLQALVTDCGGHLWMTMDPQGDMVLKIHLPRRVLDSLDAPAPAKPGRARWIERLAGVRR